MRFPKITEQVKDIDWREVIVYVYDQDSSFGKAADDKRQDTDR